MHTAYAVTVSPLPPLDDKVKPVAVEWAADGVRAWAASRGLDHTPLGMLPGLTPALAAGYGTYARTDDGRTAWALATPETITPERLDEVARSAARASAPALV
jgi:hypothetical protein